MSKERIYKGKSLDTFPDTYTVLDIETTGFDPSNDKILEIGALKVFNGNIVEEFEHLIYCEAVPPYISSLTGITPDILKSAPPLEHVLGEFLDFAEDFTIVGHNVHFDINFIYDKCLMHLNEYFQNNFVDTLRISRRSNIPCDNYKLETLCSYFGFVNPRAHRALDDCYATNFCYQRFMEDDSLFKEPDYTALANVESGTFYFSGKQCLYHGSFKISDEQIEKLLQLSGARHRSIYTQTVDIVILSQRSYDNYIKNNEGYFSCSEVLSENDFYKIFNLPLEVCQSSKSGSKKKESLKVSDIRPQCDCFDTSHPLFGQSCVFTGQLSIPRKEAMQIVVDHGGFCTSSVTKKTNFLIVGSFEYESRLKGDKSSKIIKAEESILKGQNIQIVPEQAFWDMVNDA